MSCAAEVWSALAAGGVIGGFLTLAALFGALAWAYRKGVRGW